MKKLLLVLLVVCAASSTALVAQSNWAKSYDKDGQFNIYGTVGLGLNPYAIGFGASIGGEYIITNIKIGDVLLPFGVGVRGAFNIADYRFGAYNSTWVNWGVGPFASLHLGLLNAPIEFFISAGLAVTGQAYNNSDFTFVTNFPLGFLTVNGVIFHVSPAVGIVLEWGSIGYASAFGIGVQLKP